MIRINFRGLMNQHRMSHVWQGTSNQSGLWVLIVDCTRICTRRWNFCTQSTSIAFSHRVNRNCNKHRKCRTFAEEQRAEANLLSDFPHENSVLCVLSPNPPNEKSCGNNQTRHQLAGCHRENHPITLRSKSLNWSKQQTCKFQLELNERAEIKNATKNLF